MWNKQKKNGYLVGEFSVSQLGENSRFSSTKVADTSNLFVRLQQIYFANWIRAKYYYVHEKKLNLLRRNYIRMVLIIL